jgi:hypothetical protein
MATLLLFIAVLSKASFAASLSCESLPGYSPAYYFDSSSQKYCLQKFTGWECKHTGDWKQNFRLVSCGKSTASKATAVKVIQAECRKLGIRCNNITCVKMENTPYCSSEAPSAVF